MLYILYMYACVYLCVCLYIIVYRNTPFTYESAGRLGALNDNKCTLVVYLYLPYNLYTNTIICTPFPFSYFNRRVLGRTLIIYFSFS